jgi:hypothetical protein
MLQTMGTTVGAGVGFLFLFILPLIVCAALGVFVGLVLMGVTEFEAREAKRAGRERPRPRWGAFALRAVIWGALGWDAGLLGMIVFAPMF